MQFATIGDATLHVEASLRKGRPNVVFIHALGADLRIFDDVVEALARAEIGALRFDLRGHGLSDLGAPPRRIDDHARDVEALMENFGLERATICGVSVGGAIALALSERAPARVERLMLCCTGAKIGTEQSWNQRIAEVESDGVASIAEAVLRRWFPPDLYAAGGGAVALARNMISRTPVAGYIATCVALRDSDLSDAARAVRAPALCVAGEMDGSTPPELVKALDALLPGSRYREIAGAGHLPCLQKPAEFTTLTLDFIESAGA